MLQVHHSFETKMVLPYLKKYVNKVLTVRGLCPWCLWDTLVGVNDSCSHTFLHRKPKPFLVKNSRQTYSLIKFVQQLCSKIAEQHHGHKSLVDNIRHERVAFNINFWKLLLPFAYIPFAFPSRPPLPPPSLCMLVRTRKDAISPPFHDLKRQIQVS